MILQSFNGVSQASGLHNEDERNDLNRTKQDFYDAKENIHMISKALNDEDVDPPIEFTHRDGPDKLRSRSFLRALNRCRDLNAVQEEEDQLRLTEVGATLTENLQRELSDHFTAAVEKASERRRE